MSVLLLLALLLFLVVCYTFICSSHRRCRRRNLPPSPWKLPIFGNLHQVGPLPHRSLQSLSRKLNSSIILLQMGQVPTLVVSSAAAARDFLKTHDHAFASRPFSMATSILSFGPRNISFSPYGDHWRQAKKASVVHLLSPKRVSSFSPIRHAATQRLVDAVSASARAGEEVNLSDLLKGYSNTVISEAAAGRVAREEGREAKFRIREDEEGALLGGFQVFDMFPSVVWVSKVLGLEAKLKEMAREREKLFSEIIEEHKRRPPAAKGGAGEEDFVDVLLSLAEDGDGDFVPTTNDIKAIVLDMVAAGSDTSYIVLDWAMAELVHNPTILRHAQEEVREVCNGKPIIEEDDLNQMMFLKAVVKEVLRLHPPAPLLVPHESVTDTTVQGYEIPSKTRVIINVWTIGRDPELWEHPEEFKPERFLNSSVDYKGNDFAFIPFGAGRRMCPGIHFAMVSVELALAKLLYWFNWELAGALSPRDMDMSEVAGITTPRKSTLSLIATHHIL